MHSADSFSADVAGSGRAEPAISFVRYGQAALVRPELPVPVLSAGADRCPDC
jgi:hypothetical protein